MAHTLETEHHILGGNLPVIVVGRIHPAEPDVGCGESAEIDDILFMNGKSIPTRMWQRISWKELDACQDALLSAADGAAAERFWDRVDYYRQIAKDRALDAEYAA